MALLEDSGKLFYSISEVAHEFDVNAHTLRFWEDEFEMLSPERSGIRRKYSPDDIRKIRAIYTMLKVKGMTIKGAKELLSKGVTSEIDKISGAVERLDIIKA
ncbi:MAG: MerR family transcriptional regulator, partial [Rikenellaceae bacterium]